MIPLRRHVGEFVQTQTLKGSPSMTGQAGLGQDEYI